MGRAISNYMMHLLFGNPEMLMAGTRRNLFETAYKELLVVLKDEKDLPLNDEEKLMPMIIDKVKWMALGNENVRAHQASHHQAVEEEEDPEDDQGGDKAKDEVQEEGGKQEGVVKRGRRIRMENRKYKGAEWAV
ncbi:hypothetical protein OsI_38097 [Oryza sativa Indica Group]|uniref:Uncharacterized protein n=1 Tax=Oryza sativa subsp. indica TaxID=39946 RepID=B8BPA8_ORYSI|nr:hypothetical protein OsI_38097 [Oryza sativa Indica Group]